MRKAPDGIQCKVDGIELNVRYGMNHCTVTLQSVRRALRYILRLHQFWQGGSARLSIG